MQAIVKNLLQEGYSPEQISEICRLKNIKMVSHETIYLWIWEDKRNNGVCYKYLCRQGRKYMHRGPKNAGRGHIPNRVDIEQPPEEVNEKTRFGDFEIDTVIGKNHQGAILTIKDRFAGKVWIRKLTGKDANLLANETAKALFSIKDLVHTITADNGKEFAKHENISAGLEIEFCFCKPYHAWERGANETTNGLIRQYIPKKTDFAIITGERIAEIEDILNNRPRKRVKYMTSNEKFEQVIHTKK